MRREAVLFGSEQHLVGIATSPSKVERDVAVLLLTAGMLPSSGPFRLHEQLSQAIASAGLRSLRFDLSGIGESLAVGTAGRSIDRAAQEASQAMDWMQQRYGTQRFILFGLCSGADDSVQTALVDPRVVGLVMMDGCGYRTRGYWWRRLTQHYAARLLQPACWMRRLKNAFKPSGYERSRLPMGTDIREFPPREIAAQQFQSLADRGVSMHFCYTGGVGDYYNGPHQFSEMFVDVDWGGKASTRYFPFMDHVAMLSEDRSQLIAHLVEHIAVIAELHHRPTAACQDDGGHPIFPANALPRQTSAAGVTSLG